MTNRFRIGPGPDDFYYQPVIQLLPDGGVVADPESVNPGGFQQAALRYEHRVPAIIPQQSMTLASFSTILEKPDVEEIDTHKTYYGYKFTFKGSQRQHQDFQVSNTCMNFIAETAKGVAKGKAEAAVSEARHEPSFASLILTTSDSELIVTRGTRDPGAISSRSRSLRRWTTMSPSSAKRSRFSRSRARQRAL